MYELPSKLTLSWRRFLSYRNQFIDLLCKWLLYERDLRHERVNENQFPSDAMVETEQQSDKHWLIRKSPHKWYKISIGASKTLCKKKKRNRNWH